VTVKKLDKIMWSRSGRPVAPSDRKVLLAVLRRVQREDRMHELRRASATPLLDPEFHRGVEV
jgi:hypothetical protein